MALRLVTQPDGGVLFRDHNNRLAVTVEADNPSDLSERDAATMAEMAAGPGQALGIRGESPPYPADPVTGEPVEVVDKQGNILPARGLLVYRKDFYVQPWRGV